MLNRHHIETHGARSGKCSDTRPPDPHPRLYFEQLASLGAFSFTSQPSVKHFEEFLWVSFKFTRFDSRAALAFPALVNRTSKRDLYLEAMTKALLLDHPKLFIGAHKLLDAKLWYRGESIIVLYHQLTQIQSLKREKAASQIQRS